MYTPATLAYVVAIVEYSWTAVAIVAFFSWAAIFRLHLFRNFSKWPTISKIVTYVIPAYVALGFTLPVDAIGWWAAAPMLLFSIIAIIGAYALRRANIER
jgi:hypothetical protein